MSTIEIQTAGSPDFPRVQLLYAFALAFIDESLQGEYPEDEWASWSDCWDINMWMDENGTEMMTFYTVSEGSINTSQGISINVSEIELGRKHVVEFSPLDSRREVDTEIIKSVNRVDNIVEIIVSNKGDHPTLITLDLDKSTFTTEGYD